MYNWLSLDKGRQVDLLMQAGAETGLPPLSKVYGLIERFSEDVDLAIDRGYFGYDVPSSLRYLHYS